MKSKYNSAISWLNENGYEDIAKLINTIQADWKDKGNKQRRNWWDILAGDKFGNSRVISGQVMPVLRAAQIRKKIIITSTALSRNENEAPPVPIKPKHRWTKKENKE